MVADIVGHMVGHRVVRMVGDDDRDDIVVASDDDDGIVVGDEVVGAETGVVIVPPDILVRTVERLARVAWFVTCKSFRWLGLYLLMVS